MSKRLERIKALIVASGRSYQELESITGIKKSSLQRYATGTTAKIPLDVIEKLARTFNVSQEYLMGWDESSQQKNAPELSEGERIWLQLYNKLSERTREAFITMADAFDRLPEEVCEFYLASLQGVLANQKTKQEQ